MKILAAALLMALAFNAGATNNNPPNECGNHGNNCQPSGGTTNNEANSNANGGAGGNGTGIGLGVGIGLGQGGQGGEGGKGGSGGIGGGGVGIGGDSSAGVIGSGNSSNNNKAEGGTGVGFGGDQAQGQQQGQGQTSSNKNVNGQAQSASSDQRQSNANAVDASSRNANQSTASGNTTVTNVGGDSTLVERNAPPVFLGAITPTSCGGSFNAGGSNRDGAGALGWSWVGKECRMRMIGDRFQQLGQVDVACNVYKATKGFRDAAKINPKLNDVDCSIKPAPPAAVVPAAPVTILAPRTPRG